MTILDTLPPMEALIPRKGNWMQTASGAQFWPIDPRPGEIDINDIAHALSMLCRFGGHCKRFYSVAEHCVHMSRIVSQENKLWALLHDASEAYLVDVPRPIKPFLVGYKEAEEKIMNAVCVKFNLEPEMPDEVKIADNAILFDEAAQNMAPKPAKWDFECEPLGIELQYWSPEVARNHFMKQFHFANRFRGDRGEK